MEPHIGFDFDQVERNLGEIKDEVEQLTPKEVDAALKLVRMILEWQWQNGSFKAGGLATRSVVCCWILLGDIRRGKNGKELRKQCDVSSVAGIHPHAFNKWLTDFKRTFGGMLGSSINDLPGFTNHGAKSFRKKIKSK